MKKRLNFITLLIGVAVGISIINSEEVSLMKVSFMAGLNEGLDSGSEIVETGRMSNKLLLLSLESIAPSMPSELMNIKSGQLVPAYINRAIVLVPVETESGLNIFLAFLLVIMFFPGVIMVIYNFIRIILAVNKSVIFEWINVKRLRRIGIGALIMFIINSVAAITQNNVASAILEIENYKIINSSFDGGVLMLGMISFLVAEIFALGLKLREEQEFTI